MNPDELLAIKDKHDFSSELFNYLLDKEPDLSQLHDKVYTCHWVISQIDNGGLTGMLYNADNRPSWCREVAGYCRELGAETSASVFDELAPIFSLPETEGATWGEYLEKADPEKKLDQLSTFDPYDELFALLVTFAFEKRNELVLG